MAELRTFVFTDIVRSVELKREMPGHSDAERDQAFIVRVLTPHRERIERELAAYNGRVVSTAGDGHFLVFSDTISAARWAIGIQRSHRDEPIRTSGDQSVSTRISIHLGIPQVDPRDPTNFVGKPIDYASRLSDYATGGQILVSRSVVVVLEDAGMDGVSFYHHGRHELKGIGRVDIYELVYDPDGPHQMLREPRATMSRQWTVLPPTVGLTEFQAGGWGRASASPQQMTAGGPPEARPQASSDDARTRKAASVAPLKLGNYLLEERVGSGGMGEVYRARHSQFGRLRAVKVIRQQFVEAGHQEVIRRFYQEIKAVGALEHPNIVVAIDSSAPTDPVHYLVMEYIDGVAADDLVRGRRQLPVAEACEIARQAARGLAYIHQHGMVHRDIKPSNLMLTLTRADEFSGSGSSPLESGDRQAVVKILDLGLALLVGEDQQRFTRMENENRTMGTAMYMSPEQWKTTSVDIRADIYSLGCTLYHLLAGKPPFFESDLKPEKAHEREPLPPIRSATPIPRPLWDVLTRMTAKNPGDRFSDPTAVAAALAPFAEGHRLAHLVEQEASNALAEQTDGLAKSDTRVAQSAQSDTQQGRSGSWARLPKTLPPAARQNILRATTLVVTLVAVTGIGWLAWQATGRRESAQEALEARGHALQLAAGFATSEILNEINLRFDILDRLAADADLRRQMNQILREPNNEALWTSLENWLGARKADYDRESRADSWFINDVRGIQVARSPHSDASLGVSYAQRDYFHGLGVGVPENATDLKPITAHHLSAVYRSTSSGHLKVAFSVPIENGLRGKDRGIVGVLAMSVDLGEFDFKQQLPPGQEVVLIDLREARIDDVTRRGLVLHHQAEETYQRGEAPPWISSELLARFDELLADKTTASAASKTPLIEYSDAAATGGKQYRAALKPVIDYRPDDQVIDTRWLVLVQEPVAR